MDSSADDRPSPSWRCRDCGEEHLDLAFDFGPLAPQAWLDAAPEDQQRGELNADMCYLPVAGVERFFLRGRIPLGVDGDEPGIFYWSVWVTISREDMLLTAAHWTDPDRTALPAIHGVLASTLPYAEPTVGLPLSMITRPPGTAPIIELDGMRAHPLVVEQRTGISLHRVAELNAALLARS